MKQTLLVLSILVAAAAFGQTSTPTITSTPTHTDTPVLTPPPGATPYVKIIADGPIGTITAVPNAGASGGTFTVYNGSPQREIEPDTGVTVIKSTNLDAIGDPACLTGVPCDAALAGGNSFTIEAWIHNDTLDSFENFLGLRKLQTIIPSAIFGVGWGVGVGDNMAVEMNDGTPRPFANKPDDGEFHYYVYTYNGISDQFWVYVDGIFDVAYDGNGWSFASGGQISLGAGLYGAGVGSPGQGLNGSIRLIRIWGGGVLSPSAVFHNYNAEKAQYIVNTPTITETPTTTPTPTWTFTPSVTSTVTDTPTDTPTDTITLTPTVTPTVTGTLPDTPTVTETPLDTNTPVDTPTQPQLPTDTVTDTPTDTPTVTDTVTETPTPSDTPTATDTPNWRAVENTDIERARIDLLEAERGAGLMPSSAVIVGPTPALYQTIQGGIDSITDDSAENQRVVLIAPGTYPESVSLADTTHVSLQGLNGPGSVVIDATNGIALTGPTVGGECSIRNLTIRSRPTLAGAMGIRWTTGELKLDAVDVDWASSDDGISGFGVKIVCGTVDMDNCEIVYSATGSIPASIFHAALEYRGGCQINIRNTRVSSYVTDSNDSVNTINILDGAPVQSTMNGVEISSFSGGGAAKGIFFSGSGEVFIKNIDIQMDGTGGIGHQIYFNSSTNDADLIVHSLIGHCSGFDWGQCWRNFTGLGDHLQLGYVSGHAHDGSDGPGTTDIIEMDYSTGNLKVSSGLEVIGEATAGEVVTGTVSAPDGNGTSFEDNDSVQGMFLETGGNVGFNDSNPAHKVDVDGDANVTGAYRVDDTELDSTHLTDGGDLTKHNVAETLVANWVNTLFPWADDEVLDNLTMVGGTVNNSVIGGVTPAPGTFTTLRANELSGGTSTGNVFLDLDVAGAQTEGNPSITWYGDRNTGIRRPGSDEVACDVGGNEGWRLSSLGRFGIGRAAPSNTLHVLGRDDLTSGGAADGCLAVKSGAGWISDSPSLPGTNGGLVADFISGIGGDGEFATSASASDGGDGGDFTSALGVGGGGGDVVNGVGSTAGDGGEGGGYSMIAADGGDGGAGVIGGITNGGVGGDGGSFLFSPGDGGLGGDGIGGGGTDGADGAQGNVVITGGNLLLGTANAPDGEFVFAMGDRGASPPTMGIDTAAVYAYSPAATTHVFVVDETGSETQISPHSEERPAGLVVSASYPQVHFDQNRFLGTRRYIAFGRLAELVEALAKREGLLEPDEYIVIKEALAEEERLDWDECQDRRVVQRDQEMAAWDVRAASQTETWIERHPRPGTYEKEEPPKWLKDRMPNRITEGG